MSWGKDAWGGKGGDWGKGGGGKWGKGGGEWDMDPWTMMAMMKGKGGGKWGAFGGGGGGGGGAWGKGGGGGDDWGPAKPDGGTPNVHWLTTDSSFPLVQEGLPETAPAILYDKSQSLFQSAHHVLSEVVEDVGEQVVITHDEDWQQFPGIGEQFKELSREENCFAIACSKEHGKWAAGFHSGKKGRESAAKLALAIAIAAGTEDEAKLIRNKDYPGIKKLFSGEVTLDDAPEADEPPAKKKRKAAPAEEADDTAATESTPGGAPVVTFFTVPEESNICVQGYPTTAPAMEHSKAHAHTFGSAGKLLKALLGEIEPEIHHDPEWTEFPEVAEALKTVGIDDNCYALGLCPTLGKWGVGVASGWKNRELAVRMALAVAVASEVPGTIDDVIQEYPDFYQILAGAGMVDKE